MSFFSKVITALNKSRVSYAVVGGYAVALHGAVRGTVDIDLVLELSQETFEKVEKALLELGLASRLPISAVDVINFRDEYLKKRNLVAWNFYNPKDMTEQVDILIHEDARKIKTTALTVGKLNVQIASIEDLIRMKQKSGRPQDIEDIKALKRIRTP